MKEGVSVEPQHVKEGCLGAELAEVCMDMMARYTYSNLSTLPSRYGTSNVICDSRSLEHEDI